MEHEVKEAIKLLESAISAHTHGRKATCREKLAQAIDILLGAESRVQ